MSKWVSSSIVIWFSVFIIQGCTTVESTTHTALDEAIVVLPKTAFIPTSPEQFPIETLYSLLVAEIAASRQQFDITLNNYIDQANVTNDSHIIARTARIAQFFNSRQTSLEMGLRWLQHQPNNREAITLVANAYIELKQPLIALDYTEKLFLLMPPTDYKSAAALVETIANFSKRVGKQTVERLIKRFEVLDNTYPDLTSIKIGLSILHQSQNHLKQAREWADLALKQEPNHTTAVIQDVLLLQQTQQSRLATIKLKAQLEKDPGNHRLRLTYARLLTQTDINQAYEQFTQLSQQVPNHLDIKFSRALVATELKKTTIAIPLFEELLTVNYRSNTTRFYLGYLAELTQQATTALDYYLAVKAGKKRLPAQNRAGKILIQKNELVNASKLFTQLRTDFPNQKEQIYINEADALTNKRLFDSALKLLNQAIEEFPDNISLRRHRAIIYEKQNKLILMENDLRHVLTIDPNNVSVLNDLGYVLATRTQRYEEALKLINQALTLRPEDAAIIDSMGWVVFKLGRITEAISYLQKAFSIFPDPEIAAHLGEALWIKGKKQQAREILKNTLQNNPNSPQIIETIQRLGISL
ncbi:hypothetical protein AB835_11360 [Candidatus Endobugula sertula]|uniref:Tetratricopeptide repeat-like domain-containing protein n=1 Tax=Candidatus Endobugula sertula TaxID=62101 RepID=A0A1D2QN12_9GAMM|nr:hypothetical protein AB835_11360 [Candidatus Endobugula sertula]